jgi:hypothetical protein
LQALASDELDAINGWVNQLGPIVRSAACCADCLARRMLRLQDD